MNIQQLLEHHGIAGNPFADEDAQTDLVFKGYCIRNVYHPSWDKIYGDPTEPATAIVFGDKGSGKTALGLQIAGRLGDYNINHPGRQVFVVRYDDFNPFLDRFRETFSGRRRRVERALERWMLWDHMDAILSLAVTQLVDRALEVPQARHPAAYDAAALPLRALDRSQARDLLLLAACYDRSTAEDRLGRWNRLRRRLRIWAFGGWAEWTTGISVTLALAALFFWLRSRGSSGPMWTYLLGIGAAWLPAAWQWLKWTWRAWQVRRHTRVLGHESAPLRRLLMRFTRKQIAGQPLPDHPRTDDRYALLGKLQNVLRTLGFGGVIVLVDRLDEPHLINGSAELMRALLWPMLDNKFLKHPGLGLKLLLPSELLPFVDREGHDFYQRARLDKQNLIRSLEWTGQSLYDLADARVRACAAEGKSPALSGLFDEAINGRRLQDAFASLRVPRHLFKFMYRLLSAHCNAHSEQAPVWQVAAPTFESVLAIYARDREMAERGVGTV